MYAQQLLSVELSSHVQFSFRKFQPSFLSKSYYVDDNLFFKGLMIIGFLVNSKGIFSNKT